MSEHFVGSEGNIDAEIACVLEKPASDEVAIGRPAIGPTGSMFRAHLRRNGLHPGARCNETCGPWPCEKHIAKDVYITNSVQHFDDARANPSVEDVIREQPRLYRELSSMPNLKVIIAVGNHALASLGNFQYTGFNKEGEPTGIMDWRGSILPTPLRSRVTDNHDIPIKMVPTLHPSFYVRGEWRYKNIVEFDIARAIEEKAFPGIVRKERSFYVSPTFTEACEWLDYLAHNETGYLSFDIETVKGLGGSWYITCIAFSDDPSRAFCIPFMHNHREPWFDFNEEIVIRKKIQAVLMQPNVTYVTQNGLFDCWHLRREGFITPFMINGHDTMYAHRLIAADLPHDLGFLNSIYTNEPYYKGESGSWEKFITVPENQFFIYNCKDACQTLEIAQVQRPEMGEHGIYDYYRNTMHKQWNVLMDMRIRGMRIDRERLAYLRREAFTILDKYETFLIQRTGMTHIAKYDGKVHGGPNTKSYLDMQVFLGEKLHCTGLQYTSGGKSGIPRVRTSEEILRTYAFNNPHAREEIMACVYITQQRTLLSNFLKPALDPNDFYHPGYDLSHAKSGRLSSQGADEGGFQAQNLPVNMRTMIIADDDDSELTQADLKQAEAMVVAWDAEDPFLMAAFNQKLDMHRVRACVIYRHWDIKQGLPPLELMKSIREVCDLCASKGEVKCSHSERFIAKMSGHAFNYKMSVNKFISVVLPGVDIFIPFEEGLRIRNAVLTPHVLKWQKAIEDRLRESPILRGPLGRFREFYGILNDDMIREALAWQASHIVSDVTNPAMIKLYDHLPYPARVITQTHDSCLISHKKSQRSEVYKITKEDFYNEIPLHGRTLTIPVDLHSASNWGAMS